MSARQGLTEDIDTDKLAAFAIVLSEISLLARTDANQAYELLLDVATDGVPDILKSLRHAVLRHVCWAEDAQGPTNLERDLYPVFIERHVSLIPGSEIVKAPRIEGHVPDFVVRVNDRLRPVEVKRGDFNIAAVRQLARYIDALGADIGYAVAPTLTAELPANMIFIEVRHPSRPKET